MRIQYFNTISATDVDGTMKALSGVQVTVRDRGASTTPNIYVDKNATSPIAGSQFITVDGIVDFWVDPGEYDIVYEDTVAPPRIEQGWKVEWNAVPAGNNNIPGPWLEPTSVDEDRFAGITGDSFVAALLERLYAPGDVKPSYQPADHPGWLLMDGRNNLALVAYPELGALMQAQGFAGIDAAHFAIPDAQGRMLVGKGSNAVISTLISKDSVALASRKPHHSHSRTLAVANAAAGVSVPSSGGHSHGISDPGHGHPLYGGGGTIAVFDSAGMIWVAPVLSGSSTYWLPWTNGYHATGPPQTDNVFTGIGVSGDGAHGHSVTDPQHSHGMTGNIGDTTGPQDVVPYHATNYFIKT